MKGSNVRTNKAVNMLKNTYNTKELTDYKKIELLKTEYNDLKRVDEDCHLSTIEYYNRAGSIRYKGKNIFNMTVGERRREIEITIAKLEDNITKS